MSDEIVARNRLRLLPPIRRSRQWRLYAEDGRRFLDFWMDGGRSLLGAKGRTLGTVAKAAVDTGLTRPFPSIHEARLEKALLARYPGYAAVRLFRDEGRAAAAAAAFLPPGEILETLMPFAEHYSAPVADAAGVVTPGVTALGVTTPGVTTPRFPCPAAFAPAVLLFRDAQAARTVSSDLLPPLSLACAHRAIFELIRFEEDYTEELWKKTDRRLGPYFERRGPYLRPRAALTAGEGGYDRLFAAALGAGILLSPDPAQPSMVPGEFDDGELHKLAKALVAIQKP